MTRRESLIVVALLSLMASASRAEVVDLEDLSLPSDSYYNGSDPSDLTVSNPNGDFQSRGASFNNSYTYSFDFDAAWWSGWAYSNQTVKPTDVDRNQLGYNDFDYQYSAAAGGGANDSSNYAIAYDDSYTPLIIALPAGKHPLSIQATNTTFAALSLEFGDAFNLTPFTLGDWLLLTITALGPGNLPINGESVSFYLARYTSDEQYIHDTWQNIDLSTLVDAQSLLFSVTASDGGFGIPTYVAIDDLVVVPEPSAGLLALLGLVSLAAAAKLRR